MIITIPKAHGNVKVNASEIELLVTEQLKMVPGIVSTCDDTIIEKLKILISDNCCKSVRVYPISKQTIGVSCHVKMFEGTNFNQVAKEAQSIIKFSIEKKYEIDVDHVDIIIDGFDER